MIAADILQIVFSDSGAGGLKHAANTTGRKLRHLVQPCIECAHVGPIDLLNRPIERVNWIKDNAPDLYNVLLYGEKSSDANTTLANNWRSYIDSIVSWDGPATIWFSKYDIEDMSRLLILSQTMPNFHDVRIVEISELKLENIHIITVGGCNVEQILKAERLSRRFEPAEISQLNHTFKRLQDSPLGLRMFINKEISEAPIDQQDKFILKHVGNSWQKAAQVFGHIFNEGWEEGVHDRDYIFLLSRLHYLTRVGKIERRGESSLQLFNENPLMGEIRLTSN